jgi:hypothetical protein
MSYSRRELYALGEPLGDSATFRKADGGLVLGDGGGGGSAPAPANTTTTTTSELPEWARGYAKDTLAKGAALTDISQNPYQQYGNQRNADFSNLQKESFAEAGPQGFGNTVGQYMSPYINDVLNNQIAASNRGYDISGTQEAARATQAGAFGGGRQAIMQAENERARNSANQTIVAQGLQNAFQGATSQYNQGLQQLSTLGGQQQAQAQKGLDTQYQDFLNQQNYPYKQLSYMSDLIHGTPVGMQSSNQVYQAPPTAIQNIAGLGLGAAGIASLAKADGGVIRGYAGGGDVSPMHDEQAMSADVSKLSDAQLQQVLQHPTTKAEYDAAQQEAAFRASMHNGLASAVTPDMVQKMAGGGGVLAFAGDDEDNDPQTGQMVSSPGDPRAYGNFNQELLRSMDAIRNFQPQGMSEKDYNNAISNRYALLGKMAGPDPYAEQSANLAEQQKAAEAGSGIGKAGAFFKAAQAAVQGNNAIRGIAGAGAAYGEEAGKVAQAEAAEKRALSSMKFNLLDAQRKERMGMSREAIEAANQARKDKTDLNSAEIAKQKALGTLAAAGARATKPTGGAGAGNKEWTYATKTYLPLAQKKYPNATPEQQQAYAYEMYQNNKSAGLPGSNAKTDASLIIAGSKAWTGMNDLKREDWAKANGIDTKNSGWEAEAERRYVEGYKPAVTELHAKGGTIGPIKLD